MSEKIDNECSDCNENAVKSSATRVQGAQRMSSLPVDNKGNLSSMFSKNQMDRKNGQSRM